MSNYLSVDMGSSNIRIMLVNYKERYTYKELARIPHTPILINNEYRWDIDTLINQIIKSIDDSLLIYNIESIGICSWGVDYCLISENGLFDLPYCYRNNRNDEAFKELHKEISEEDLYRMSGIYPISINTIYQLYADKKNGRYSGKELKIVMIADYLAYKLTNRIAIEKTNASTGGLLSLDGKSWNKELINLIGLDSNLFPELITSSEIYGYYKNIPVCAVCTHDTASAILSMGPMNSETAFLSSGSWMLIGKILDEPNTSKLSFDGKYTNERGYKNQVTFLNNINGLYIIQRIVAENNLNYKEIDDRMNISNGLGIVDVNNLINPINMTKAVMNELKIDNADIYDLIKTVYDSLAIRISKSISELEKISDTPIKRIIMTGGATRAKYLCEKIIEISKKELVFANSEGAIYGNAIILNNRKKGIV